MRVETMSPARPKTMMLATATTTEPDWGRPRRQTDPNINLNLSLHVERRPSELLRQVARRSADCSVQRPKTSSARETSTTNSNSHSHSHPQSPSSSPSHRSSLSVHALSNPALAEIPLRKFRLSTSSPSPDHHASPPSPAKHQKNSNGAPCTPDLPARNALSTTPISPKTASARLDAGLKSDQRQRASTYLAPQPAAAALSRRMSSYSEGGAANGLHDPDRTLTLDDQHADDARDSSADESRSKNEDVFLNIAKSTASRRDSTGKLDRRRVSLDAVVENIRSIPPPKLTVALPPCRDWGYQAYRLAVPSPRTRPRAARCKTRRPSPIPPRMRTAGSATFRARDPRLACRAAGSIARPRPNRLTPTQTFDPPSPMSAPTDTPICPARLAPFARPM